MTLEYIKEREQNKGLQKGLRQGRQEKQRIVLNMLKEKATIRFVSKVTGLSIKEIKQLKNGS